MLKRLRMVGLTALNNSLMMSVDENMIKYDVPVFCINEARSYSKKTAALNNLKNSYVAAALTVSSKIIQVKVRSTRTVNDVSLDLNTAELVSALK